MKTKILCAECSKAASGIVAFFTVIFREDGLYTGKCPKGHDLFLATQTLHHEMLFEIGLNAVVDGYYREAVSSFAASVERFFEFALRVLMSNHKTPPTVINDAWRRVASQSERQYGAYLLLYVATFGELLTVLSQTIIELRNEVIHKGKLPEKGAVLKFGKAGYDVIQNGMRKLRADCIADVNKALGEHVHKITVKMGDRYPRGFQVTQTALNVIEDISKGFKPFEQLVKERGL
jgi:hypothetical protein